MSGWIGDEHLKSPTHIFWVQHPSPSYLNWLIVRRWNLAWATEVSYFVFFKGPIFLKKAEFEAFRFEFFQGPVVFNKTFYFISDEDWKIEEINHLNLHHFVVSFFGWHPDQTILFFSSMRQVIFGHQCTAACFSSA